MDQPPTAETPTPSAPTAPTMSLAARLFNVVAVPGEVFEQVKNTRSSPANWIVPILLASVVGAVASFILFSQPAIVQQIREQQSRAFEERVKAGKMSQADADRALAAAERFSGPGLMKLFGAVGSIFYSVGRVFLWGTALWLLGRLFLRARFGYMKAVEAAGLATVIAILGTIVTLLLQVIFSSLTISPSLALLLRDFDPNKTSHQLLAAVNVFSLWQLGVMASALARLAGSKFTRAGFLLVTVWLIWTLGLIGLGVLLKRLFG